MSTISTNEITPDPKQDSNCPIPRACFIRTCCPEICSFIYRDFLVSGCLQGKFLSAFSVWIFAFAAWGFSFFTQNTQYQPLGLLVIALNAGLLYFYAKSAAACYSQDAFPWILFGFASIFASGFALPAFGALFSSTNSNNLPLLLGALMIASVEVSLIYIARLAFCKAGIVKPSSCCAERSPCPVIPCEKLLAYSAVVTSLGVGILNLGKLFGAYLLSSAFEFDPDTLSQFLSLAIPLAGLLLLVTGLVYREVFVCCFSLVTPRFLTLFAAAVTSDALYWQVAPVSGVSIFDRGLFFPHLFLALAFFSVVWTFWMRCPALGLSLGITSAIAVLGRTSNLIAFPLDLGTLSVPYSLIFGLVIPVFISVITAGQTWQELLLAQFTAGIYGFSALNFLQIALFNFNPLALKTIHILLFISISILSIALWLGVQLSRCLRSKCLIIPETCIARGLLSLIFVLLGAAVGRATSYLIPIAQFLSSSTLLLFGIFVLALVLLSVSSAIYAFRCCGWIGILPSVGVAFSLFQVTLPLAVSLAPLYQNILLQFLPLIVIFFASSLASLTFFFKDRETNCKCLRKGLEALAVALYGAGIGRTLLQYFVGSKLLTIGLIGSFVNTATAIVSAVGIAAILFSPYICCDVLGAVGAFFPTAFHWSITPTIVKAVPNGLTPATFNQGIFAGTLFFFVGIVVSAVLLDSRILLVACTPRACKWPVALPLIPLILLFVAFGFPAFLDIPLLLGVSQASYFPWLYDFVRYVSNQASVFSLTAYFIIFLGLAVFVLVLLAFAFLNRSACLEAIAAGLAIAAYSFLPQAIDNIYKAIVATQQQQNVSDYTLPLILTSALAILTLFAARCIRKQCLPQTIA